MSLSHELRSIRQSAEAIGQRILTLQASGDLDRRGSMDPNEPLRHHRRGPALKVQAKAYRFSYTTTRTSNSMEPRVQHTKVEAGLNELDAEIRLRQAVRKEGLYLRTILSMEPVA